MTDYHVVLLVEQALSSADAIQIHGLHEDIEDSVRYHVLLPVEDAAAQIESGIGALATGEVLATPALLLDEGALDEMRQEILDNARAALAASVGALTAAGALATGEIVSVDPIEALAAKVTGIEAAEAIVLTVPTSSRSSSTSTGPPGPAASSASRCCTCWSTRPSMGRPSTTAKRASPGSEARRASANVAVVRRPRTRPGPRRRPEGSPALVATACVPGLSVVNSTLTETAAVQERRGRPGAR